MDPNAPRYLMASTRRIVCSILPNNSLGTPLPNQLGSPKQRKITMTQIIGIIAKNGIVLAAESQTTIGNVKRLDTDKLTVIPFANGQALIAEAGSAPLSGRVVEGFKKDAQSTRITDDSTISKLLLKSLREVVTEVKSLDPLCSSPKLWQDYFLSPDNSFELMLAYYFAGKPYLFKFYPLWGIPARARSLFETSGIGSDLSGYLLKNYIDAHKAMFSLINQRHPGKHRSEVYGIDCEEATMIAIYVIETVKQYVESCAGPTKLGIVRHPDYIDKGDHLVISDLAGNVIRDDSAPIFVYCQSEIDKLVKTVSSLDAVAKAEFWCKITKATAAAIKAQTKQLKNVAKAIEKEFGHKEK